MSEQQYIVSASRLDGGDAAAALILIDNRRYLMQLRDQTPGIFYPGHWGAFGGSLNEGETYLEALRRELREELELEFESAVYFTSIDVDYSFAGLGVLRRAYYVVNIEENALARLKLHEGTEMRDFTVEELLALNNVTPYDSYAIWLRANRGRIGPGEPGG